MRAAIEYARQRVVIRRLVLLQIFGVLFFTISVPVEVVFAEHSLHAGSAGYGALLSAWGAGAVAGAAIYARWRGLPSRSLIVLGAACARGRVPRDGGGAHTGRRDLGAAFAGIGNGVEAVAARTALQEETEERWMALMMSFNESLFQSVPGAGIVIGGAITALGGPRAALAVAGAGSLAITAAAWLRWIRCARHDRVPRTRDLEGTPIGGYIRRRPSEASGPGPAPNGTGSAHSNGGPASQGGPHDETPPAPIGRHQ